MKKYTNIGDLLVDYRNYHNKSQADLAAMLDMDIRTIQRWERNITLVKPEKEIELVEQTFLPRQLVRNLNSTDPIPTYFDFKIRKYSLSELDMELPSFSYIKDRIVISKERLHTIDIAKELDMILRYNEYQYHPNYHIKKQVAKQAIQMLPELNLFLADASGYYAGHSLVFCLKKEAYEKIKKREILVKDLSTDDLTNYKYEEHPYFLTYSVFADSNEGVHYLLSALLDFYKQREENNKDYTLASITMRYDNVDKNEELNLQVIWQEELKNENTQHLDLYRFYEGKI